MYMNAYPLSVLLRHLLIFGLLSGLAGLGVASGQTNVTAFSQTLAQASEKEGIRERISAIIRETIKQGEGTVNGIKFYTRVPPSDDEVQEIKNYGDKAVPILEEILWSGDNLAGDLALRVLGLLGGSQMVEPLKRVVEK